MTMMKFGRPFGSPIRWQLDNKNELTRLIRYIHLPMISIYCIKLADDVSFYTPTQCHSLIQCYLPIHDHQIHYPRRFISISWKLLIHGFQKIPPNSGISYSTVPCVLVFSTFDSWCLKAIQSQYCRK